MLLLLTLGMDPAYLQTSLSARELGRNGIRQARGRSRRAGKREPKRRLEEGAQRARELQLMRNENEKFLVLT